ncbi:cap-specific mRNA (nucleoside-2'-O-)-methyltransferase 1 [Euwallacea fornicatus]|uniref:cap-specific mRNA (nucleoside-2'-O-)-methyltransferase 1 n=1 Tax=Euwallacea fornicatus TaxID=995702 RepID=UPI0033903907
MQENNFPDAFSNASFSMDVDEPMASMDSKAMQMMKKMGYKPGLGLGKQKQGITESIQVPTNLGKRGLGLKLENFVYSNESWDLSEECLLVEEKVEWLVNEGFNDFSTNILDNWVTEGCRNEDVVGNSTFCDPEVLKQVFKAKDIFDELDVVELNQARARANAFETIRSVFFMNRAALKMANIDAVCNFMFTSIKEDENTPIYFADVCAGPGGFTEYILWRKGWSYKGFGLTLKDEHDFRVSDSTCASPVTFQTLYGADNSGDVCNPDNLKHFSERVFHETNGGVHFMMSDGGFCVDGQENLQEILSKHIYTCQCLLALNILRPNGNFVTKTFDIFTPFSVGLLYLMYLCFEKVAIIKPNTSRPANSERYFVCSNLKVHSQTNIIRQYLWKVAIRLWENRTSPDRDILEIVPLQVLKADCKFFKYILQTNSSIGKKQIIALKKLAQFCRNPNLVEPRQENLRTKCLEYWRIPDEKRRPVQAFKVEDLLNEVEISFDLLYKQPKFVYCDYLESQLTDIDNWYYAYINSSDYYRRLNYFAGVGYSKVYRLQSKKWLQVNHLKLVKGTLLYGELVKESYYHLNSRELKTRYSVHVIDAMFLGSLDIRNYTFPERLKFIHKYCKSVNKESQENYSVRVRPKPIYKLMDISNDYNLFNNEESGNVCIKLPVVGFNCDKEAFEVNSILLLRAKNKRSGQIVIPCTEFEQLRNLVVDRNHAII